MIKQGQKPFVSCLLVGILMFLTGELGGQNAQECQSKIGTTYLDSTPCWPTPLKAPQGAPNVLIIALDDVGFAQLGSYGSAIETPALDKLANGGLLYTNFHTTALCSPTRACILSGRNHHSVGTGVVTEIATGYPGYNAMMPKSAAILPAILGPNGYSTIALGKWHNTPPWEMTVLGPFDRWPTGQGFERFYGFMGGEANQYYPALYSGIRYVDPPKTPAQGYHLSVDLTDNAIRFIDNNRMVNPDKPFFLYLAYGACHAPHQPPRSWVEKYATGEYAGRFSQGWDAMREEVLARQKAKGIVPPNTELSPRPDWIPAWASLSTDEQGLFVRMQEVFAAYLSHTDDQIRRVVEHLRSAGMLDNTLLIVFSDNGASAEGGTIGSVNENRWFNNVPESLEDNLAMIDKLGSEWTYNHYPMGWAHAGNTPFQRYKRETFEGGVADPLLIHWPNGIRQPGIRTQFHHAIDIFPTILEALGIQAPDKVNGVKQDPVEGISMLYTFANPAAPTRKQAQYFEMFGMRAIWSDGWKAVADHKSDSSYWAQRDTWVDDKWALYHVDGDISEVHDLAAKYPGKLNALMNLFDSEARKYNVFPLDDRMTFRISPRPTARLDLPSYTYYPNMDPVEEGSAVDTKNRSFTITAYVSSTPEGGAEGVLISQGGRFGGYSFFVGTDKKLHFVHNYVGVSEFEVASTSDVPTGASTLKFVFTKTVEPDVSHGLGAGGTGQLYINDAPVGGGFIPTTVPQKFTLTGEGLCAGRDVETPVSHLYGSPFSFTGGLDRVVVDVVDNQTTLARKVLIRD